MFIDTHSHLFDHAFDDDREMVINECLENNVRKLIVVGFDKQTNKQALEMSNKYEFIYPTVGLHPTSLDDYSDNFFVYLEELIKTNKNIVGIGECGLDYYWDTSKKDLQKEVFKKQIELSIKYNTLFLDAKDIANPGLDGEHLTLDGHFRLASELIKIINKEVLNTE